ESFFARVRSPFHLALDALLAGCACAIVLRDPAARTAIARPRTARTLRSVGALLVVALLATRPWLAHPSPATCAVLPLLALGFALVALAVAAQPGRASRLLRSRA